MHVAVTITSIITNFKMFITTTIISIITIITIASAITIIITTSNYKNEKQSNHDSSLFVWRNNVAPLSACWVLTVLF